MRASDGHPPVLKDPYFDVAASILPRGDGQPGFFAEIDDPANPIAGVSAVGSDMESTLDLLLHAAWSALHDPSVCWVSGTDVTAIAGVRLHITSHYEVAAADLQY